MGLSLAGNHSHQFQLYRVQPLPTVTLVTDAWEYAATQQAPRPAINRSESNLCRATRVTRPYKRQRFGEQVATAVVFPANGFLAPSAKG